MRSRLVMAVLAALVRETLEKNPEYARARAELSARGGYPRASENDARPPRRIGHQRALLRHDARATYQRERAKGRESRHGAYGEQ